jgi:prolyl-tRNA synthetase
MHRWSKLFIPTLREAPADAEVASHKLLLRSGYIRQLGAGIYSYLFLGQRSINKIVAIVREEMDRIGAQEFLLPTLNPVELWQESGREAVMGQNLFHLQDRKGAELVLAMTHEEVITSIARSELRSYKQLPQMWYQIQTKFRDEPRPKSGLLRVRQFLMKDSYSFDIDEAGLDKSYDLHDAAYRAIFTRCGLDFVAVEADSGAMGGSGSQEFMVDTEAGEDLIASSPSGYAANLEKATSKLDPVQDLPSGLPIGEVQDIPKVVHTPGQRTIDEVGNFLQVKRVHQMKTMAYMVEHAGADKKQSDIVGKTRPVVVFLRGDHQLNETKLAAIALGDVRPMTPEEILATFNAPAGYLGPIGLQAAPHPRKPGVLVILDKALEGRTNLVAGANKEDWHLRNVTPGRDFKPTLIADVRNINEGEPDPIAGQPLRLGKAVEIGHIFKLGTKYTASMGSRVLNADGKEVTPIMGCYGIGIERILTSAIESSAAKFASSQDPVGPSPNASHNAGGPSFASPAKGGVSAADQYALPPSIAPFEVIVTITNTKEALLAEAGEQIAAALDAAGVDVLLDERDERAGVKFKDAELIGVPFRINIGKKLAEGHVELVNRLTQTTTDVPTNEVVQTLQNLLATSK